MSSASEGSDADGCMCVAMPFDSFGRIRITSDLGTISLYGIELLVGEWYGYGHKLIGNPIMCIFC